MADADSDGLLRPALEAAVVVAREGEEETPAVPAPTSLRPFLRFAKLPSRALAMTRRALEGDEEFRARVADSVSEADVGRAGWLYLTRPDGWEEQLAGLVEGAETVAREQADRRAEHDARRRLAAVQEAARKAEEVAGAARAEAAESAAALAEERRARQAAVETAAATARRIEELVTERDELRASLTAAAADVERLQARVAGLEKDLRAATAAAAPAAVSAAVPAPPAPPPPVLPRPPAPVVPALEEAAEAALRLAETLHAAVAALAPPALAPAVAPPAPPPAPSVRKAPARPTALRQPAPLPPAMFDDSLEAAEHLVRVSGMVLIVDGYNVSKWGWPELALPEQRRRLVDALAELAARTGLDARVVFDGADTALPGVVPTTARSVRVSFSPPGVEADDVVIDLVAQLPLNRPVLVASNDRRVRQGASRHGANVISTEQLIGVLRR